MGTFDESAGGSEQRSLMDEDALASGMLREQQLQQRVLALEAQLLENRALLHEQAREHARLQEQVEQLREANEHLVMATVSAQSLRDLAEATNRRQTEFLAMLAHELRNPLAPLSMSASLLQSLGGKDPQMAQVSGVVRRQVDHMAHLLDDLLDAARISSGKITLAVRPLALGAVLDQAVETVAPRIRERGQQLEVALPDETLTIEGDPVRLTQVFANLLGNASKYTGNGGQIALRAWRAPDEVVVEVSDNGSGIAPEMLPQVFDLFIQGPRSLARSEGGLGIGLNVVRNLVGMHGGTVTAASAGEGQGSTFTVRLPLSGAQAQVPQVPAGPSVAEGACRILLIEDNIDACDTLRTLLELAGHEVVAAYDGHAGLAEAQARHFDIVICDIGLPGIDGLEVLARLRGAQPHAAVAARPFAIALSGYGQHEDRERAIGAGFDRYLVKPAAPDALLELVGEARELRQLA